ncbi:MAG: hypothetical protein U0Q18_18340 [Bryobacteraceae bacterium]
MARLLDPFRFILIALSGWMNGRRLLVIDYGHNRHAGDAGSRAHSPKWARHRSRRDR